MISFFSFTRKSSKVCITCTRRTSDGALFPFALTICQRFGLEHHCQGRIVKGRLHSRRRQAKHNLIELHCSIKMDESQPSKDTEEADQATEKDHGQADHNALLDLQLVQLRPQQELKQRLVK